MGGQFERVRWDDSRVVIGGQDQGGSITLTFQRDVQKRSQSIQVHEMHLGAGRSIIRLPKVPIGELVISQDIVRSNACDHTAEQVGFLVAADLHQSAAVRDAFDGQSVGARVLLVDQILRCVLNVVQGVLLVQQSTGLVPFGSIFT